MKWEKVILLGLSAIFAIILFLLLPIEFEKYRLRVDDDVNFGVMFAIFYADMDGDGIPETIRCKDSDPVPAFVIQVKDYENINQWNLKGEWVRNSRVSVTDYDKDGYSELVAFTYDRDSIWLNVYEAMENNGIAMRIPVAHVSLMNDKQDWTVCLADTEDLNGDRKDELVFSIVAGFTLQPRKLYIFARASGELKTQEENYGNMISGPVLIDLEGDGQWEISGSTFASDNHGNRDVFISDSSSWLLLFNEDLDLKTSPIPGVDNASYTDVLPFRTGNKQYLVSLFFRNENGTFHNDLNMWEWDQAALHKVHSRTISTGERIKLLSLDQNSPGFFLAYEDDIHRFNFKLEETDLFNLDFQSDYCRYWQKDLDGDSIREHIILSNLDEFTIARSDFSNPVSLDIGFIKGAPYISSYRQKNMLKVGVFRAPQFLQLTYSKNPLYPFRFVLLVLSFLVYYFIFTLIANLQKKRIELRQASERQVLHYQLANVMQQLDPHFLFNALSNISSYYHGGEKEHAQSYLAKISRLVRLSLENSDRMTISLEEEISFVRDYLYVESIRMGDRFEYSIHVDDPVIQEIQLPKMLIQNFVENAMKHGVRHLTDRKGLIRVYSVRENGHLQIRIEDNGIGRGKAAEIGTFGTGNGFIMVQKILDIYEKLHKIKITFEIVDFLDDAEKPAGTRVDLVIPFSF